MDGIIRPGKQAATGFKLAFAEMEEEWIAVGLRASEGAGS
jgi:hypothetical protein